MKHSVPQNTFQQISWNAFMLCKFLQICYISNVCSSATWVNIFDVLKIFYWGEKSQKFTLHNWLQISMLFYTRRPFFRIRWVLQIMMSIQRCKICNSWKSDFDLSLAFRGEKISGKVIIKLVCTILQLSLWKNNKIWKIFNFFKEKFMWKIHLTWSVLYSIFTLKRGLQENITKYVKYLWGPDYLLSITKNGERAKCHDLLMIK